MNLYPLVLRLSTAVTASGLALAQNPSPSLTFSGGAGSVPAGAVSATYDALDQDSIFDPNDVLIVGNTVTLSEEGWTTGTLPLECQAGSVAGGAGSSGETCATVYVVVTFRNDLGQVVGTVTSGTKNTCCTADT
jgi:hypothetical protein